jgi:lysophospholipase L1-like esterase
LIIEVSPASLTGILAERRRGYYLPAVIRPLAVLSAMLVLVGACDRAHLPRPSPPFSLTVLAFGDSITEGQNGDPPPGLCGQLQCIDLPNAYPTLLAGRLEEAYPTSPITVVNAGRGGEPAIGVGEARLPMELAAHQPDALLLLMGTNDLGPATPAEIASALRRMIITARNAGVTHILVSTLLPQRPGGTPPRGGSFEKVAPANEAIRPMVAAQGAILVDAYAAFAGNEALYLANDGLHVTPLGNHVLANLFFNGLQAALGQ